MKISEMSPITSLTGKECIEIVQDGVSRKCTIEQIASSQPDAYGVYPDVPLNRVTLKRFSGQTSTIPVIVDNLGMIDSIVATAYPVLIDRNSNIVAYLNGNDLTNTVDGLPATLDDWTLQAMLRCGGFYKKYEYNAATNEKIFKFSTKKVRGYKYVRSRFLNLFGGTVETQEAKQVLLSNKGKWTTQNYTVMQYHEFAKNLGANFREIATQDREVYRFYFWLMEKTFNSQSVLGDLSCNPNIWGGCSQETFGGQSSYGQFHLTGYTNSINGHKGIASEASVSNGNSSVSIRPYKFLWRENMISGPYSIFETGYLMKDGKVYRCRDLSKINFTITADYEFLCNVPNAAGDTYILEDFEDTLIPQLTGGSSTTGHCDGTSRMTLLEIFSPIGVFNATSSSSAGISCFNISNLDNKDYLYGGALASDNPTDTIVDNSVVL